MQRHWRTLLLVALQIALGSTASQSIAAPPTSSHEKLLHSLQNGNLAEREQAARQLGAEPDPIDVTAPALLQTMLNDRNKTVTINTRSAMVAIGRPAVPHILTAMENWPTDRVRELVVLLAVMGHEAESAIPRLKELLDSRDASLRRSVTFALNNIQPDSEALLQANDADNSHAVQRVIPIPVSDHSETPTPRKRPRPIPDPIDSLPAAENGVSAALPAIRQVAGNTAQQPAVIVTAHAESSQTLNQASPVTPQLKKVHAAPAPVSKREKTRRSRPQRSSIIVAWHKVCARMQSTPSASIEIFAATQQMLTEHRDLLSNVASWVGLSYTAWLLIFTIIPVQFLQIETYLRQPRHSLLARFVLCCLLPVRKLLLLPWLSRTKFATRAWIESRSDRVVNHFWTRSEVQHHAGYVSTPVRIDDQRKPRMTVSDLRRLSQHNGSAVQIVGPSGSGKSALAVEIACQAVGGELTGCRLLPVFLRPGMDAASEIRKQVLRLLSIGDDDFSRFESLLHQCEAHYVLPVIESRDDDEAAVRLLDEVRGVLETTPVILIAADAGLDLSFIEQRLEPLTPEGDELQDFVKDYLASRISEEEIAESVSRQLCTQWLDIQSAGPLSLLFLTTFLDEFLRHQATDLTWRSPDSVVELLQRHINWQLTRASDSGFTADELKRDIAELAKMSTAKAFRSHPVRYEAALKRLGGWNAAHRLTVLEERLQLIEIERGELGSVRFRNEQFAIRLAAAERLESLDLSEKRWSSFLNQLRDAIHRSKADVEPFALALYDCCVASRRVRPDFVLGELGQLLGLDAKDVQRNVLDQQTSTMISQLESGDRQVRLQSLDGLRRLALQSDRALETLINVACDVENDREANEAAGEQLEQLGSPIVSTLCERLSAVDTATNLVVIELLRKLGPAAATAVPALFQVLADSDEFIQANAVTAIAAISPNELMSLARLLRSKSATVRAACAKAFGTLGPSAEPVVETITALLDDESEQVRLAAVVSLGQIGFASVDVVTGLIKALVAEEEPVRRAAGVSLTQLRGAPDVKVGRDFVRNGGSRMTPLVASRAA